MPDRKATSSRFIVAASAIAILFLVGVLVLTLGRVLNLQDVLLRPRAVNQCKDDCLASKVDCRNGCGGITDKGDKDSCLQGCENSFGSSVNTAGCNAQSPGCVWSCYQKVGNCSGCINYNAKGCTGPLPGGGTTKGNNTACYDSCFSKTGNGSGCKAACDASPTCFNKCVKDGKAPKSCIVPCAMGTYLTPTPVPGETEVVCQGNVNAPAKCFDCLKDSQLNILDFSCFRNKYGKEVGK